MNTKKEISLDKDQKFIEDPSEIHLVEIDFTEAEIKMLENFNVKYQTSFSYLGYMRRIPGLKKTISEIGTNPPMQIQKLYTLIRKIMNKVIEIYQEKYVWIEFRSSLKGNNLDWHIDKNYIPS